MSYVLALDQGTTSSRAILFDHAGAIVAVAQQEFEQIYPKAEGAASSGWVEHDPTEILTSQLSCAVQAMVRAGIEARDVAALGITNQRETVIVWDRETGKPVYNAIVWQDRRGAEVCRRLVEDGAEPMVQAKTGLVVDPYFSATKICWILDNVSGARARAEAGKLAFGTVDSWLIWNLTAGSGGDPLHVTDQTNASRTLLYNIVEGRWDEQLLRLFRVPASLLPEVRWSSERVGEVRSSLGLRGIAIAGIAGDQQAALFGQLCFEPGEAKNTYGTGCFLLQNIGASFLQSKNRLITTLAASAERKLVYALEGSIFIGGAVVQWLRDNMRLIGSSAEVEALAASVPDADGVVFVPAFVGLGAPYWDPHASGLMIGLRRSTQPGHIARAALESIVFQVADALDAMHLDAIELDAMRLDAVGLDGMEMTPEAKPGLKLPALRVDGGASVNDLMMQFQADVLGVPVLRPRVTETTALGAAYLAGLATGFWEGPGQLRAERHDDSRFEPSLDSGRVAERRGRWKEAVERSRRWNG